MLLLPCRHSLISNNHTRRPGLQLRLGHLNYKKKKGGGLTLQCLYEDTSQFLSYIESQHYGRRENF